MGIIDKLFEDAEELIGKFKSLFKRKFYYFMSPPLINKVRDYDYKLNSHKKKRDRTYHHKLLRIDEKLSFKRIKRNNKKVIQ